MDMREMRKFMSGLRPYCLGIVTEHKAEESDVIRVNLKERHTMGNGPINEDKTSYDIKTTSSQGKSLSDAIEVEQIVEAVWIPHGDNHLLTSPNVRANETVMVYKYADTPDYYWTTVFREPTLRRLENVIYGYSNLKDGVEQPHDLESSYYFQWDTIRKVIRMVTVQSDGEQFAYILEIDPGNNRVSIRDNVGNEIELDSPSNNISLTDISGGRFETRDGFPKITGPKGVLIDTPLLTVTNNVRIGGNTSIGGGLQVSGYAHFPGGHGPH